MGSGLREKFLKAGDAVMEAAAKIGLGPKKTKAEAPPPPPAVPPEEAVQQFPMGSGYVKQTADTIKNRHKKISEIE